jgi:membrane-bound lytic murein transglycosylase MltF
MAPAVTLKMYAQMHPKEYAKRLVLAQWESKRQYACLVELWNRESHWNPKAHNKSSGAFGIAQFMPTTWANYHLPYKPVSASVQITGGLRYITKRYGSPCAAWAFWQKHYWY